jgi:hypothetical protein
MSLAMPCTQPGPSVWMLLPPPGLAQLVTVRRGLYRTSVLAFTPDPAAPVASSFSVWQVVMDAVDIADAFTAVANPALEEAIDCPR